MSDLTFVAEPSPFMHVNERAAVRECFDRLENYFPIYNLPGKHFKPDTGAFYDRILHLGSRTYCDDNGPSVVHNSIHIGLTAVVFEVEGRVQADHCYLSANGDREHPVNTNDEAYRRAPVRFASCWLVAPNDLAEGQGNWRRALSQLECLARHADSGVRMGEFIAPKEGTGDPTPALLQVSWTALPGFDNIDVLPVFNAKHKHLPIPSQAQLPLHKHVRVCFVLHLGPSVPRLGGAIIATNFISMHVLD